MLFKVYARNCTCAKRISEATIDDLKNVIDDVFQQAWENDLIDILSDEDKDKIDIKKEESAYSKIWAYWEENKEISSGDFAIVEKAPEGIIEHPFKVGDTFILEKWTGAKYVPVVCTITKISVDRVTVKPGDDRAKSLKPYKTCGGDWAIHVFDSMNGNYYKKG